MNIIFKPGDNKIYRKTVSEADIAAFHGVPVHEVCSTFAIGRDMEWASRQFVLEMKDEDEEGIGTSLTIKHVAPAFPGENIEFSATVKSISGNEIICKVEVNSSGRLVATGETGQKILQKSKIKTYFEQLRKA